MDKIKKLAFFVTGWICLVFAYIGLIVPGIPFSIFLVGAAYFFSKSSKRMENWLYNNRHFGPFLTNWTQKRVFPIKGKYAMITVMASSLLIMVFTVSMIGIAFSGLTMMLVAIWAWRYPGSLEEWQRRTNNKEKIGWLK